MNKIIQMWVRIIIVALCAALIACNKGESPLPITFFDSTFEDGTDDWTGDFAFNKKGGETAVAFNITQELLPEELKSLLHGLKIEGTNQGDSIFLFVKRKITGLDPEKTYKVAYKIDLATSFPDTIGSAGRITYFKAGASPTEPVKVLSGNVYGVSIKNGSLARSGTEMLLLGTVANGIDSTAFRAITRTNANLAVEVKPNTSGEIWLCAGVNTTYKGKITLYFDRIYAAVGEKTETE